MNEAPPLRIDLRLVLEAIADVLAFVLTGLATVSLGFPYNVVVGLSVGALLIAVNRLLGRNTAQVLAELNTNINRLMAKNQVLAAEATPTVLRKAEQAAEAIPPKPVSDGTS